LKTGISFISGSMFNLLMYKKLLISLLVFSFLAELCHSQNVSDDTKLRGIVSVKGQAEVIIPLLNRQSADRLTRTYSIRSIKDKSIHILLSPLTVEQFITEDLDYQIAEITDSKGLKNSENISEAMEWESYPSYTQYDSIMRFLATEYPSLCMIDTIGTSIYGKLVLALKISDNCKVDEPEPEVFYSSGIHGDETAGLILMLRLSEYLLKNYSTDSRVKDLVDNLEIWINPLANPDGTYRNGNYIVSPIRFNANGFDLNRNFPDPDRPAVTRQKETLDMMSFLVEHRFVLSANFHSGEEVVNFPWDRWPVEHADNDWFYMICRAWADTVHLYSEAGYMDFLDNGVTNGYDWYKVNGGRQDYVTYTLNGREITVELDEDFVTPVSDLNNLWLYNYRSLLGYFENALYGIHGQAVDAQSNEPVPARIFIEGYDKDGSDVYSDTLTGFFTRFLLPGSYNLTFTAEGYRDTTINSITVIQRERTDLTVKMTTDLNPVDTTNPLKPLFYPNPGSILIKAVLPENIRGAINVRLYNMTGKKVSDYDTEASDRNPVKLDVSLLQPGIYFVVFTNKETKLSCSGRIVIIR
jgi:hypothetical protein